MECRVVGGMSMECARCGRFALALARSRQRDHAFAKTLLLATSWFHWFLAARTLANGMETALTMVAVYYWSQAEQYWHAAVAATPGSPGKSRRRHAACSDFPLRTFAVAVIWAGMAIVLRPTGAVLWAFLAVRLVWRLRRSHQMVARVIALALSIL